MRIFCERAFLESGWTANVTVTIKNGLIDEIGTTATRNEAEVVVDTLLPAISNLHSHAFQRVMAGMTEYRAKGRESFWTWRELMYRFLDRLTPEQIGAVAELAFMEMLEAGYAAVGEFHYLHHAPGGDVYDNVAELSHRVMQAAADTGIGMTHLPVLYTRGGLDDRDLEGGQLRFGNSLERFASLVQRCRDIAAGMPGDTQVGVAPHSLRAVSPEQLSHLVASHTEGPIHIHIAEQTREVDDVLANLGTRPVQWLLDNANVDNRWCLVHATHMVPDEVRRMAQSGAVAGLCPVTEANLGDGVFAGPDYLAAGGAFGIGTDSNVNIALSEELRILEYSQRLTLRERNVLVPEAGSVGQTLYLGAARGGAQALGRNAGAIRQGKLADLVAIDSTDPRLCLLSEQQLFDGFVFAGNDRVITDVWSAGRHQVRGGRHIARDEILSRFYETTAELKAG